MGGRIYNINVLHKHISYLSGTAGATQAHTFKVPEINILAEARLKKERSITVTNELTPSLGVAFVCQYSYLDHPAPV